MILLAGDVYLSLCRFCQYRYITPEKQGFNFICLACESVAPKDFLALRDKALIREAEMKYKKD